MERDKILIHSIESYPNTFSVHYVGGKSLAPKGISVNFLYKTFMRADIILTYEELKTDNPSMEEIKDKIIEVLQ